MPSKLKSSSIVMIAFIVFLLTGCNNNAVNFEINFDTNGGSIVESVNYDGSSTVTIPDNPIKEGFIFDGWFWDNGTFENPFTANSLLDTPIEDDLTVYAKWVEQDDELTMQLKNIYLLAVQVNAFEGTYEEWLETVRGPQGVPGEDGRSPLIRVSDGILEWQLEGDSSWTVLYDLNNLAGSDGIDGQNIVLQVAEGYIQWQYQGDTEWTNLVELTTLVGPAGADGVNGIDGKQVTFQVNEGFIQWQYVGDLTWNNLIDLATITGADGTNGTDGVDGREVLFQVAEGYLQWQYTGDLEWTNLVDINTLTGVQGIGIASTSINEYGELIITYTDNTVVNIGTIYKVYTVNFVGLEGYLIDSQTVIYGSDAIAPTAPIIEGYTFIEWSQTFTNITANTFINAIYQINTYTVTFETNGGVAIDPISNIEYNSSINLPIPTKDGYIFMGWYYGEDINSGQFTSQSIVKDNLTLYARWAINAYTVTFDSNGGTLVESQLVEDNDKAIKPVDPTKEGYTFFGWFINGDEKWVFAGYDVTQNITLTAHWSINSYIVTYVQNNDQEDLSLTVHPFTELIQPIKAGYTFAGWFTTINFEENTSVDIMPANNITLYAKWDIINYQIDYVLDNGANNVSNPISYTITTNTFTLNEPIKEGYTFLGWYTEDIFINELTEITLGTIGDITLHAKWSINQCTITFDTDGGSIIESITQDYATTVSKPTDPTKVGYTFAGWYINSSLTTAYTFTTMPAEDITVYAKWDIVSYNITYNLDGGTSGDNPATYTIETSTITLFQPTKEGYTFNGWFDNAEYTGEATTQITLGNTEDIDLYAKWNINQYTITFVSNGGSLVDAITQDYATTVLESTDPTREGYTFGGWYADEDLTVAYSFTTMPAEDITVYAKWNINSYTLTYNMTSTDFDPLSYIPLLSGEIIKSVSLGYHHSAALTSNGRLFMWGINSSGQLGDGTTINRSTPIEITHKFNFGLEEKISEISLGGAHSSALTSTGRLFTWGSNSQGQLGDGTTVNKLTPIDISNKFMLLESDSIIQVALSYDNVGSGHSSALSKSGRIFTWGDNWAGQLGDGTKTNRSIPFEVTDKYNLLSGEKITYVAVNGRGTSAITSLGRLFMLKSNDIGQLPMTFMDNFILTTGETIVMVSLGSNHVAALTSNGRLFMWGSNLFGQLGDGTTISKSVPIEITESFNLALGEIISQISLGESYSSALTSTGRLFTWGSNSRGQLGDGTTITRKTPIEINNKINLEKNDMINQVYLGGVHTTAVSSKGQLFVWGWNIYSNLGDGLTEDRNIPYALVWKLSNTIQVVEYDFSNQIVTYIPEINGYLFEGWFSDIVLTIPFELTTMPAQNINVYSKWISNSYTIQFDYQCEECESSVQEKVVNYGTFYGELPQPTRSGYVFTGWLSDSREIVDQNTLNIVSNHQTLYAQWSNEGLLYNRTSDGYEVSKGTVTASHINIPAIYNDQFVTSIALFGFQNLTYGGALTSIRIPFSVKVIGNKAFYNASNLESFIIDENSELEVIGSESFMRTKITTFTVPASVKILGWSAFEYAGLLEQVIFEEGVQIEYLGYTIFRGTKITELYIPASVNNISSIALIEMDYLQNITVDTENTHYKSENGILFNFELDTVISYPKGKTEDTYIVPEYVVQINSYAFSYNTNLKFIYLPSTVDIIQSNVFVNSYDLIINVAVLEKPEGWVLNWNSARIVNWGYMIQ